MPRKRAASYKPLSIDQARDTIADAVRALIAGGPFDPEAFAAKRAMRTRK